MANNYHGDRKSLVFSVFFVLTKSSPKNKNGKYAQRPSSCSLIKNSDNISEDFSYKSVTLIQVGLTVPGTQIIWIGVLNEFGWAVPTSTFWVSRLVITRWWFQISFYVHPENWGRFSIWLIFFRMGWNHQLELCVYIFFAWDIFRKQHVRES